MTQAYLKGFSKTAEAYGVNPDELLKIAAGLPYDVASQYGYKQDNLNKVGPLAVGAGASALGSLAAAGSGPIAAAAAPAGVAFGAGTGIGTMARNLADVITEGAATRKLESTGDRVGQWLAKKFGPKAYNPMVFNKGTGRYGKLNNTSVR